MAPAYKFTYFDGQGAGEHIRYIFKYGNIEFEDIRIKREQWANFKSNTPFGQLPVLEHNGKKINQSLAIARYLAKQVKLAGKDDWENLEIDATVDTINDLKQKIVVLWFEKDEAKKTTLKETLEKETVPFYFSRLDNQVQKNGGYLVGGRLTWADLYFAATVPNLAKFFESTVFNKYSNLKTLIDKVEGVPAIKKWIDERPKTEY